MCVNGKPRPSALLRFLTSEGVVSLSSYEGPSLQVRPAQRSANPFISAFFRRGNSSYVIRIVDSGQEWDIFEKHLKQRSNHQKGAFKKKNAAMEAFAHFRKNVQNVLFYYYQNNSADTRVIELDRKG